MSQLCGAADATILAVRSRHHHRALRRGSEQLPEGRAIGIALIDAIPTT